MPGWLYFGIGREAPFHGAEDYLDLAESESTADVPNEAPS
jgi:hypothetical protein